MWMYTANSPYFVNPLRSAQRDAKVSGSMEKFETDPDDEYQDPKHRFVHKKAIMHSTTEQRRKNII